MFCRISIFQIARCWFEVRSCPSRLWTIVVTTVTLMLKIVAAASWTTTALSCELVPWEKPCDAQFAHASNSQSLTQKLQQLSWASHILKDKSVALTQLFCRKICELCEILQNNPRRIKRRDLIKKKREVQYTDIGQIAILAKLFVAKDFLEITSKTSPRLSGAGVVVTHT